MSRRKNKLPDPVTATIESLSHEGRGVVHVDGKTVFVDNALPGEEVRFRYLRRRSKRDEAEAVDILESSPERVEPFCEYFNVCGGCSLQHQAPAAQIAHKQDVLLEQLRHIGRVEPNRLLEPLTGPVRGYRRKARLGARYVFRKERVLVGFRERHSSFIADIDHCAVLHPAVGELLPALKALVGSLGIHDRIPQIEAAVGEDGVVLVLRHLAQPSEADRQALQQFEAEHDIRVWLQPGGPDTAAPLDGDGGRELSYRFEVEGISIGFHPLDFTQVNFDMNRAMLARIRELLQPGVSDNILELFCGLGNFTLPLARSVARITGVEGDAALVERARNNAMRNGIANADFIHADLHGEDLPPSLTAGGHDRVLLDPPRTGARELLRQLPLHNVQRLVYVSCNPATLARDAGILVHERGLRLAAAGVMDMFPHTSHVESIALFKRQ